VSKAEHGLIDLEEPATCCVCSHLTPRGEVIAGHVVGWCDFDWWRWGGPALRRAMQARQRRTG
jgi:hypothetical protein